MAADLLAEGKSGGAVALPTQAAPAHGGTHNEVSSQDSRRALGAGFAATEDKGSRSQDGHQLAASGFRILAGCRCN